MIDPGRFDISLYTGKNYLRWFDSLIDLMVLLYAGITDARV